MSDCRPALLAFTPLPPERNGIADYAALLLGALAPDYAVVAATEAAAPAPPHTIRVDLAEADRRLAAAPHRVLHQVGNNPGHGFVLRALRRHPGIVTLHDPGLGWLYETAGESLAARIAAMAAAPAGLGEAYARHRRAGFASAADPLLFDHAGEVLARAQAVVVHSRFAQARLRALHGARAAHVAVVPHLLPPLAPIPRAAARARLGLPADAAIVLTAGFGSAAKRLDWMLAAVAATPGLLWVHAGEARPGEYDLAARIAARVAEQPELAGRARVTGWLDEAALTAHLAAADALVNLRFPSLGESSGTLARAFALGVCAIVSDTGAYAELPAAAVLHVPLATTVPALTAALGGIVADRALAQAVGTAGQRWARRAMALPAVATAYRAVIEAAWDRPPRPAAATPGRVVLPFDPTLTGGAVATALRGIVGPCRLQLVAPSVDALAERTLAAPLLDRLPPWAELLAVRVRGASLLLDLELPWRA